jgi:hypothetical protein
MGIDRMQNMRMRDRLMVAACWSFGGRSSRMVEKEPLARRQGTTTKEQRTTRTWGLWLLTCGLLLVSTLSNAQTKPFSPDQVVFLEEITAFMVEADKKEGKPFMEDVFAPAWNSTFFTNDQRARIVALANYMLKKRFEAFPAFHDYLASLAAFVQSGRSAQDFEQWMKQYVLPEPEHAMAGGHVEVHVRLRQHSESGVPGDGPALPGEGR